EKEAYDDFISKLTEGKRAVNKHIRTFEREAASCKSEAEAEQRRQDDQYVSKKLLETKPIEIIAEISKRIIREELAACHPAQQAEQEKLARTRRAQEIFVENTPEYLLIEFNGKLIVEAVQATGAEEFTLENITAAYNQLLAAGKLQTKASAREEVAPA